MKRLSLIKSRKDNICDFLLLLFWYIRVDAHPFVRPSRVPVSMPTDHDRLRPVKSGEIPINPFDMEVVFRLTYNTLFSSSMIEPDRLIPDGFFA